MSYIYMCGKSVVQSGQVKDWKIGICCFPG